MQRIGANVCATAVAVGLGLLLAVAAAAQASEGYYPPQSGDKDLGPEKKVSGHFTSRQFRNALLAEYPPLGERKTELERAPLKVGARVCLVGDTGNESAGQKAIAAHMKANACDQVRHLGDLIYYIGIEDAQDPMLKSRFLDIYQNLHPIPMYLALGNHDYAQSPDAWLGIAKANEERYVLPNHYYAEYLHAPGQKGLCFVTLDSTPFDMVPDNEHKAIKARKRFPLESDKEKIHAGMVPPRVATQLRWLEQIKGNLKERCNATFSFMHHPVKYPRANRSSSAAVNALYLKTLIDKIDFAIVGHDHYLAAFDNLVDVQEDIDEEPKVIPEILSGSGGMLQLGEGSAPVAGLSRVAYQKQGYVEMTVKSDPATRPFTVDFTYWIWDKRAEGGDHAMQKKETITYTAPAR